MPRDKISQFCKRWKVVEFAVFGSALRDDFGPESDLDILATFSPDAEWGLLEHVEMKLELQSIFEIDVDMVTRRALEQSRNWIRREEILSTAKVLYSLDESPHATECGMS